MSNHFYSSIFGTPTFARAQFMTRFACAAMLGIAFTYATPSLAQNEDAADEIVVTGSRTLNRSVLTTPSPVDVLGQAALEDTAQSETGRAIQNLAPSFNFPSTSVADGTDALKPATLRGLSPDQTLVLINGRRRHKSALIHVNTSVGRGTAGTDMNAIAPGFVDTIEILRDGASAQYGSDAIGGVINLKLREITDWNLAASYGETTQGDGETIRIGISKGFEVGDGHIFWGAEYRDRGDTNRAGNDGQLFYQAGNIPAEQFPADVDPFSSCLTASSYKKMIAEGDIMKIPAECVTRVKDGMACTASDKSGCDQRDLDANRRVMRVGDASSEHISLALNGEGEVGPVTLGGFLLYSTRDNESAGFFRQPDDSNRNVVAAYPDGFLPLIQTEIADLSYNFFVGWDVGDWNMEAALTSGANTFDFTVANSINATFGANSPNSAYSGGLEHGETIVNFDASGEVAGVQMAVGAEYKLEEYEIIAGDPISWANCNNANERAAVATSGPLSEAENCLAGKAAGIQVFPGFRAPIAAFIGTETAENPQFPAVNGATIDRDRASYGAYYEVSYEFESGLVLDGAIRFENYEGFGDALAEKFSLFYPFNDNVAIRGTISNGYRAPSLHQLYFNTIATQFVAGSGGGGGVFSETLIAANDSALVRGELRIPELQEEQSLNIGFGIVATPTDNFDITADLYQVKVDDRVTLSSQINNLPKGHKDATPGLSDEARRLLTMQGVTRAQFFINAADTITRGIDIVANWSPEVSDGELDLKLAWNFTETSVDGTFAPPGVLAEGNDPADTAALRTAIFGQRDRDILERWQPREKLSFTADYSIDDVTISTSLNRYGEYYSTNGDGSVRQIHDPAIIINFRVHWQITETTRLSFLGDNIFDQYPDAINHDSLRARTGPFDSQGAFVYSRQTAPYGFNGAFVGVKLNQSF